MIRGRSARATGLLIQLSSQPEICGLPGRIHPSSFTLKAIYSENEAPINVNPQKLIVHPKFDEQWWPSYDIGLIKTSQNGSFNSDFTLETDLQNIFGEISMFGAGRSNPKGKNYERTNGENSYFRVGSVLFFIGTSKIIDGSSGDATSAPPNDSGGPVLDKKTGKVIGVITTTTLSQSVDYGIPTLSTATSILSTPTRDFILKHLGPYEN